MQHEKFMAVERFGSLDGLRAFAILAVLWHHSGIQLEAQIAHMGQMGVHLFFAISGFLITSLMIREKAKYGAISLRAFFARRSLRIFPLYYAMLGVYILAVLAMERGTPEGEVFFANLIYYATYTSNWFVEDHGGRIIFFFAWSLAVEEQFYLTWPWVEKYARAAVKFGLLAAVIALVAAVHFGALHLGGFAHTVVWLIAPCILLGVLMAHVMHSRRGYDLLYGALGHRWSAPAIAAALVVALSYGDSMAGRYVCFALLTALVGACVIREDNGLAGLLKLRPLVRIGVVSYGIYLMHMLTFSAVQKVITDPWLALGVGAALVWAAAELSFATFERQFLKLKPKRASSRPRLEPLLVR